MIFITDWFSTFLKLAGVNTKALPPSDSKDVWRRITKNKRSRGVLNLDRTLNLWKVSGRQPSDAGTLNSSGVRINYSKRRLVTSQSFMLLSLSFNDIMTLSLSVTDAGLRQQC